MAQTTDSTNSSLVNDADFDQYISMKDIGNAIDRVSASDLQRLAAKLVQAEKEIGRTHHSGITSQVLFKKSIQAAADKADAESLTGFSEWLDQNSDLLDSESREELKQLAKITLQLNAPSRMLDDVFTVDIESFSTDGFLFLRQVLERLAFAKLTGDSAELDRIQADVEQASFLPDAQRESLNNQIRSARQLAHTPQSKILRALATISRSDRKVTMKDRADVMTAQAKMTEANSKLVTAYGDNLKKAAETAKMLEEVEASKLDNRQKKAELYFHLRKLNADKRRHRHAEISARRAARNAFREKNQSPGMLYAGWPSILDKAPFLPARNRLQQQLTQRSPTNSGAASQNYALVRAEAQNINQLITSRRRDLSASDYVAVRRFLRGVLSEAREPITEGYVAERDPLFLLANNGAKSIPAASYLNSLNKLAANTRSIPPARLVSAIAIHPETFVLFQSFVAAIRSAIITGDDASLASLKAATERAPLLGEKQKNYLLNKIAARDVSGSLELPDDPIADVSDALARIAGLDPPLAEELSGAFEQKVRNDAFESLAYLYSTI